MDGPGELVIRYKVNDKRRWPGKLSNDVLVNLNWACANRTQK